MELSDCHAGDVAEGSGTAMFTGKANSDREVGSGTKPVFVGGAVAVNTQQMGGAVTNGGFLSVKKSVFLRNTASAAGGAIYCGKCELEVEESRFEKNRETNVPGLDGNGGAIFLFVPAQATIKKSEFVGNEAQGDGGALSVCPTSFELLMIFDKNARRKIIQYRSGKDARLLFAFWSRSSAQTRATGCWWRSASSRTTRRGVTRQIWRYFPTPAASTARDTAGRSNTSRG